MGSPYQLILLNLIHILGVLNGAIRVLVAIRRRAAWRSAMIEWKHEQERQLRVLLVLFKQIGGQVNFLHSAMLFLAEGVGLGLGFMLSCLPHWALRYMLKRINKILADGYERAGHQISIAEWSEWQVHASINPPKALLELAAARREWVSRVEPRARFL